MKAGGLDEQARANVAGALAHLAATPPLTGRPYELADEAYKAAESGQLEHAMRLASEALTHAPGHPSLLLLQADLLSRQQRHAEALEAIRRLGPDDLGGAGLAQRGYLWLSLRNSAAAQADFVAAIKAGGLEPQARANVSSELAYLALARNDDAAALGWFRTALETSAKAGVYADGGYAAMRLGRNRVAAELFTSAVDEWHAAPPGNKPFDETALYGMRRSVDTLSRRWGASFTVGHSSTPGAAAIGSPAAGRDLRVLQAGAEVFYTPESFGYRNGRVFQVYASAFQALSANDEGYATGADSRIAGLGARYKPLEEYNLVFALERRLALGDRAGDDDWLARVGWSASRGTDWEPVRRSWTTWQVYTESVYFIEAGRLVQPFDARIGRSWKLPQWHGAVVTPYLGIAGEYDEAQSPRTAAGIGPGISARYWFGETRHRAFPGRLDFSLQYRFRLTDARRGGGLFGQLSLSF
jgi:tetratricopeptide (TPR) repeat protein